MNSGFLALRPSAAGVLVAAVFSLAACSGEPASSESTGTATESVQATQEPATATPTPTGTVISTSKGSYVQVEVPEVTVDPAIIAPETYASFSPADIDSATAFIIDFMVKEGIDSPLNGGGQTVDEWWAENQHLISPPYQQEIKTGLLRSTSNPLLLERWQEEDYGDAYQYIYSSDATRVSDLTIAAIEVYVLNADVGTPALALTAQVSYHMKVVPGVGTAGTGIQKTTGTMSYSASRSPETGQWQIDGWKHEMDTFEG